MGKGENDFYHTFPSLNEKKKISFENIVGKGGTVGNQHFPLFALCFLPFPKQMSAL